MVSASGKQRPRRNGHPSHNTARALKVRRSVPDIPDVLGRFSDALATLTVAHHSLCAKELGGAADEEVVFRQALDVLKVIYNDLDVSPTLLARSLGQ